MKKVLLASTALLLLGAAPALPQQKTVKIGFISTFSGPVAAIGNDMRNSFELALDHLGRKIGGMPVEVIYEDDQIKPEVGVQKTQKLIESDKVDFIVGYIWSNVLLASLKPLVDSKTIRSSPTPGASQIAGELCSPYVFSTSWNNDQTPAGDRPLHEPEGREDRLPDRPELRRRQGHAGGRRRRPSRARSSAANSPAGRISSTSRPNCRRRAPPSRTRSSRSIPAPRHPVHHPVCAVRPQGPDPALHRVHDRRDVAAAPKELASAFPARSNGSTICRTRRTRSTSPTTSAKYKAAPSFYGAQTYDAAS